MTDNIHSLPTSPIEHQSKNNSPWNQVSCDLDNDIEDFFDDNEQTQNSLN